MKKKSAGFQFGIEETEDFNQPGTVVYQLIDYRHNRVIKDYGIDKERATKELDRCFELYMSSDS